MLLEPAHLKSCDDRPRFRWKSSARGKDVRLSVVAHDGNLVLSLTAPAEPGTMDLPADAAALRSGESYRLRAELLDAKGGVVASSDAPFAVASAGEIAAVRRFRTERGMTLVAAMLADDAGCYGEAWALYREALGDHPPEGARERLGWLSRVLGHPEP